MRTMTLLALCALVTLMSACKKDKSPSEDTSHLSDGVVRFDQMMIGQRSQYILLKGDNYKDPANHNFEYFKDTLEIEVVAEDENGFLIKERLTDWSASVTDAIPMVPYADVTFYYYLRTDGNTVKMTEMMDYHRARLFFFGEDYPLELPLDAVPSTKVAMESWKTDFPYKEERNVLAIPQLTLNGELYENAIALIDNRPLLKELPGQTHVFSPEFGLLRSSQYSYSTRIGFGWDLIK